MAEPPTFRESVRSLLRDRILDAAHEIICDGAWSDITMARLAKRVGVSRQTVYNEVGSKDAVGQALVLRELERFLDVVTEQLDHADNLPDAVEGAVREALTLAADNPLLAAIFTASHGGGSELLPWLTTHPEALIDRSSHVLREAIGERQAAVGVDPVELDVAIDLLIRLLLSHVMAPGKDPAAVGADLGWVVRRTLYP